MKKEYVERTKEALIYLGYSEKEAKRYARMYIKELFHS